MPPRNSLEQGVNGSTPPPNPDQDPQEEPATPDANSHSHPTTIAEAKQVRRSGCGIRRLVTLCGTVTQLVAEYDRRLVGSESDGDDEENDEDRPERREEIAR